MKDNRGKKYKAIFTDKELDYIYDYLQINESGSKYKPISNMYLRIEKKIRKQVTKYDDLLKEFGFDI